MLFVCKLLYINALLFYTVKANLGKYTEVKKVYHLNKWLTLVSKFIYLFIINTSLYFIYIYFFTNSKALTLCSSIYL